MAFEMHDDPIATHGLCNALVKVGRDVAGLCAKLKAAHGGNYGVYWLPVRCHSYTHARENDFIRATFAYLMAAMTDSERDAIVEGL